MHPLVRQRRAGDVAAQLFQPLAILCFEAHRRVQPATVPVDARRSIETGVARHRVARRQLDHGQAPGNEAAAGAAIEPKAAPVQPDACILLAHS